MRERTGYLATGFAQSENAEIAEGTIISIILIRHGATAGNAEKCYIGARTDEPLSEEGRRQLTGLKTQRPELSQCKEADGRRHGLNNSKIDSSQCIQGLESDGQQLFALQLRRPDRLYASPMRRCLETADILFDGQKVRTIENFRETDFGAFEGKNYMELSGNPDYQAWIDSNGEMAFPGGESREAFIARCVDGMELVMEQIRQQLAYRACPKCRETEDNGMIQEPLPVAAVVHGGTIMALLSHYCGGDYFSYQVKNAEGYHLRLSLQENKMELKEKV